MDERERGREKEMRGTGNTGVGERRPIEEGIKNGREKIMTHTYTQYIYACTHTHIITCLF